MDTANWRRPSEELAVEATKPGAVPRDPEANSGLLAHGPPSVRGGMPGGGPMSSLLSDSGRSLLSPEEAASPLAEVPYLLRHAGVSLWLESGVAPAEVARRAGHSIAVLFRFYAKAIHRNQQRSNEQIERSLDSADEQ
ncbi:hypothetical protein [Streptomyces sp. NPDC020480]|uniref:hypothetical protein n=1 Tax=Streptomyces sp. NPDC020480 TaxID=3365076 RepID=UPI0037B43D73